MKRIILLSILIFNCICLRAQKFESVTCTEGTFIPSGGGGYQSCVATDIAGNIYSLGTYQGTLILGTDTLISYGNDDMFLAKMDASGNYLWTEAIGSNSNDNSNNIAVDASANIYVSCSNYLGPVLYTSDSVVALNGSGYNLFSFDSAGSFRWVRTGYGSPPMIDASLNADGVFLSNNANIQRIDSQGNLVWQKTATGSAPEFAIYAIDVNENGNLAFTIHMFSINGGSGTVSFDTVNVPYQNALFARLVFLCDTSGSALWGRELAGNISNGISIYTVAVSTSGEVYVGMNLANVIYYFANDTIVNPVSPSNGAGAILKFDSQGTAQWARAVYSLIPYVSDLVINPADEIVFCGSYANSGYCYFGPFSLPPSGVNPFICKLSSGGNYMWAKVDPRTINNITDDARNLVNLPGNKYMVGGLWQNFFGFLDPFRQGCNFFTPGTYPQGHYFSIISESVEPVPVVDFTMTQAGKTVLFKNTTQNITSLQWNFGDVSTSTFSEPIHDYAQPGMYNVCLSADNNCGTGQLCKSVEIKGIRAIQTNHAANTAVVTAELFGGGFTSTTTVSLKKSGNPDIVPIVNSFISGEKILLRFNFTGQTTGAWDVEVTVPGDTVMTLANGFTLEPPQPYSYDFVVGGSRAGRLNRWLPSTYTIYNRTNADAVGVPVLFRYNSVAAEFDRISIVNPLQVPFLNAGLQYLQNNSLNTNAMDKFFDSPNTSSKFGAVIIPLIKANSSVSLPIYLNSPVSIEFYEGGVPVNPLLTSSALTGVNTPLTDFCMGEFLRNAVEKTFLITISPAQWNNCYPPLYDSLLSSVAVRANDPANFSQPLSWQAFIVSMLSQFANSGCITGVPAVLSDAQINSVIDKTIANFAFQNDIGTITPACPGLSQFRLSDSGGGNHVMTNEFCDLVEGIVVSPFSSLNKIGALFCKFFGNSIDPNQKNGPGNNNDNIWQQSGETSSYTIAFENVNTASAPASVVTVIDTLDVSRFDFSTFRFSSVSISDSLKFEFDEPGNSQLKLSSLVPFNNNLLRTEATFDTTSGEVKWIFTTVDNVNFQPDNNPLNGFLPPNINGTEGTGYISFDVQLKSSLVTGDSINNVAQITFDNNAPIITNNWLNVIDITKPQSAVSPLPPNVNTTAFNVSWSGTDFIAGIRSYSIYVSENDAPYELWLANIDTLQYTFNGVNGNKYEFFSKAIDRAGNIEDAPVSPETNPDAVTVIVTGIEENSGDLNFSVFPNPARSGLEIHSSDIIDEVKIFDVSGRTVLSVPGQSYHVLKLNISELNSTLYYIQIISGEKTEFSKFIKQ